MDVILRPPLWIGDRGNTRGDTTMKTWSWQSFAWGVLAGVLVMGIILGSYALYLHAQVEAYASVARENAEQAEEAARAVEREFQKAKERLRESQRQLQE